MTAAAILDLRRLSEDAAARHGLARAVARCPLMSALLSDVPVVREAVLSTLREGSREPPPLQTLDHARAWAARVPIAVTQRVVLARLVEAWRGNGGLVMKPITALAQETGASQQTVLRALAALRAMGLISVEDGGGRGRATAYRIHVGAAPAARGRVA